MESYLAKSAEVYDLIVLIGEAAGVYAKHFTDQHVVWDKANVFTAFCLNSVVNLRDPRQRFKFLLNSALSYVWERRVLRLCDAVWVTAPEESLRLERTFHRTADAVIRSSIRLPSTNPRSFNAGSRKIVWMSTFAYPPNWDGLLRLLREAGDTLRSHNMKLCVVGAGASPEQIAILERFDVVEYLGFVAELDEVFENAAAGVVPIWAGAGVKLKTLTMMSRGLPVVSTPSGMEGIPAAAALRVAASSIELVEAVAQALPEELERASVRAFNVLRESFSEQAFNRSVSLSIPRG
ncbi:glycosyltransferase family 4 protein [Pseudarthrobacter niigatensis]|uniref:Glycosyltransferase involved in cell wall biosynthesis n=1 Tax=Pseudarthrobacter niigatensis TaxID=369935 RepID=A0AAJ1SRR7_9MICC|nr:glycosyltransferase [Pseudarthrobacter niigatensis]MDQ0145991.1 glycosyltransferase involved in cell wall biosynthesis [Pseudarthrobacter niigatensis]MDQ0266281.1 glycosyltransferase involved in cell wall biosynthesis [Pseudarthrobacter niigatensis]